MTRRTAICLLCCLGAGSAQDGPFRVQTSVVQVPVTITGKSGRSVDGLTARDFKVLDNGIPQRVTVDDFSTGLAPISLTIAIQTAGISTPALVKIRNIGGMIQPLVIGMRGEAAVVAFDSRIRWLQDFTSDDGKIRDAVKNLKPALAMGQARMLDAIVEAAARMQQRKGRKLLLLISEARDRGSETTLQKALETVERDGIEVFGAHYSAYATSLIAKPKDLPDVSSPPEAIDLEDGPNPPATIDYLAIIEELVRQGKTNVIQALARATGGSDYPFARERSQQSVHPELSAAQERDRDAPDPGAAAKSWKSAGSFEASLLGRPGRTWRAAIAAHAPLFGVATRRPLQCSATTIEFAGFRGS